MRLMSWFAPSVVAAAVMMAAGPEVAYAQVQAGPAMERAPNAGQVTGSQQTSISAPPPGPIGPAVNIRPTGPPIVLEVGKGH